MSEIKLLYINTSYNWNFWETLTEHSNGTIHLEFLDVDKIEIGGDTTTTYLDNSIEQIILPKKIKVFNLSGCMAKGIKNLDFSKYKSLKHISLYEANLPNLQTLIFPNHNTQIELSDTNFPSLKTLDLRNAKFPNTEINFNHAKMPALETLILPKQKNISEIFSTGTNFSSLKTLDFNQYTKCKRIHLESFNAKSLELLTFPEHTNISLNFWANVLDMPSLKTVRIGQNEFTPDVLKHFMKYGGALASSVIPMAQQQFTNTQEMLKKHSTKENSL